MRKVVAMLLQWRGHWNLQKGTRIQIRKAMDGMVGFGLVWLWRNIDIAYLFSKTANSEAFWPNDRENGQKKANVQHKNCTAIWTNLCNTLEILPQVGQSGNPGNWSLCQVYAQDSANSSDRRNNAICAAEMFTIRFAGWIPSSPVSRGLWWA